MKQILCFLITICLFTSSCQSQQSKAMKDQQKAYNKLEEIKPGNFATTDGGWTMTCTMNGKPWKATSMFPPKTSDRIIGYKGEDYIGFPFKQSYLTAGYKTAFKEGHAADLGISDDVVFYSGTTGEMVITKVSSGWVEGTFHFTATTSKSPKTVDVTNGFFRVKIVK